MTSSRNTNASAAMPTMLTPPVVDVSRLLAGDMDGPSLGAVDAACSGAGLFSVSGHGIDRQLADAFSAAHAFFTWPQERKDLLQRVNRYGYWRNPTAEYLDMGLAEEVNLGEGGLTKAVHSYQQAALRVAVAVLEALAVALEAPGFFAARMTDPQCRLRFLRYPAADAAPVISRAHTDYGAITLLALDGRPGLEVLLNGAWRPVAAPAQSLIVQLGDMLARWTNDRYKSTPHRVVGSASANNRSANDMVGSAGDRYSIPFFINPDPATVVECIPSCGPGRYKPVTAGEFLISRIDGDTEPYV